MAECMTEIQISMKGSEGTLVESEKSLTGEEMRKIESEVVY